VVIYNEIRINNVETNVFKRDESIPHQLSFYQPTEINFKHKVTNVIKKEFEELNNSIKHSLNSRSANHS